MDGELAEKELLDRLSPPLMRELLELGETAVAAATEPRSQKETEIEFSSGKIENRLSSTHVTAIRYFEEYQTIPDDSQNL